MTAEFYVSGMLSAIRWWFVNNKPCTEEEMIQYFKMIVERKKPE